MDPLRQDVSLLLLGQLTRSFADSPVDKGQEMICNKWDGGSIQQLIPHSDCQLLKSAAASSHQICRRLSDGCWT